MKLPDNIEKRLAELGTDVEDLRTSEGWTRWLTVRRRFHKYSARNTMLIALQRPDATVVAGFHAWKDLNRIVTKGERGIYILAPVTRKNRETEESQVMGFRGATVFDVSQTHQIEDAEVIYNPPVWPVAGACPPGLLASIVPTIEVATGLEVIIEPIEGGARGVLRREIRKLLVQFDLPEAAQVAVVLHEMGHFYDPYLVGGGDYGRHRDECELVAESVAWLVGQELGVALDDEVTHYLATWEGDADALVNLAVRVTSAAGALVDVLGAASAPLPV